MIALRIIENAVALNTWLTLRPTRATSAAQATGNVQRSSYMYTSDLTIVVRDVARDAGKKSARKAASSSWPGSLSLQHLQGGNLVRGLNG